MVMTFLPYPDFTESFRCLDKSRLGNQVYLEGKIILNGGWLNHPASKMWKGHHFTLCQYLICGVYVMNERKWFREETINKWYSYFVDIYVDIKETEEPPWLGDERVHSSHRANLLYKNPEWYGQFGWTEKPRKGYYWPV